MKIDLEEINVAKIRSGDVIVVKIDTRVPPDVFQHISRQLRDFSEE